MIISIDASKCGKTNRTGVENFAYELILNLKKIDHENTYLLFTNLPLPNELKGNNFQEVYLPRLHGWFKIFLPYLLYKHRPEVHLQPYGPVPLFAPKRTLAVIHDLAFKYFPEAYTRSERARQEYALASIAKRAKKIVTVSNCTKRDLIKYFPKITNRVETVYLGYDKAKFHPIAKPKDVLKIDSSYILYTGRLEEKKNTLRLVQAFLKLKKEKGIKQKLVLAGNPGDLYQKIYAEINKDERNLSEIILPGHLSHDSLPDLIAGADLFAFPSLYEGFGLSLIEAMGCGVPVVTSNTSALPEVGGDGALYVDPLSVDSIADGMYQVLPDVEVRNSLKRKSLARAADFSWEKTAESFKKILEEI